MQKLNRVRINCPFLKTNFNKKKYSFYHRVFFCYTVHFLLVNTAYESIKYSQIENDNFSSFRIKTYVHRLQSRSHNF